MIMPWPLPLKGVSQLVTKWQVTSWLLECGYEWASWVRVDLVTSRSGYDLIDTLSLDSLVLEKKIVKCRQCIYNFRYLNVDRWVFFCLSPLEKLIYKQLQIRQTEMPE